MTQRVTSQSSEMRRAQILNATLHMIGENGIEGLTTSNIAKMVGIAESTIFKHFTSKMDILQTLAKTFTKQLLDIVERIKNDNTDANNKLIVLFEAHLNMLEANQGIPRFIFGDTLAAREPIIQETIRNTITQYTQAIQAIIEQGIQDKIFNEDLQPELAANLFLSIVQHTVLQRFATGLVESGKANRELALFLLNMFSQKQAK